MALPGATFAGLTLPTVTAGCEEIQNQIKVGTLILRTVQMHINSVLVLIVWYI